MEKTRFIRASEQEWRIEPFGDMRVPAIIYADELLIADMDDKVFDQITNVATLPGIVKAAFAMPDAHWGYGFPIGGVAAFDAAAGGIVSGGGVGFDISCGVRTMTTGISAADIARNADALANALFAAVPAGLGSRGAITLSPEELDGVLLDGAEWAIRQGYGLIADLERIEERGRMAGAQPEHVSLKAKQRQRREMGTLGSGNHYLEIQKIDKIHDNVAAERFGLRHGEAVVTIHCGSRGLGHQIGTEYLADMVAATPRYGLHLPDRELACAPINSDLGQRYLGAMRAGINCALANREIIGHFARDVFNRFFPEAELKLLFDVSHNTCKVEKHVYDGREMELHVHRKGATRAFGPGHPNLPTELRDIGQPVLIGGSMGTSSHVLVGAATSEEKAFSSACHGAGRAMSRHAAAQRWKGRALMDELKASGILIRSPSARGVAEESPGAYKDVDRVVDATEKAGLARKVAKLRPMICIKG